MRSIAVFEILRHLRRPSSAMVAVGALIMVFCVSQITGPGILEFRPWLSVSERLPTAFLANVAWLFQDPAVALAHQPNDFIRLRYFQGGVFAHAYSKLYAYHGLVLSLIGLVVGIAGTREIGTPLSALPIPAARRLAGALVGRVLVIAIYHLLAWPAWGFLALYGPFPTWGLLVALAWPVGLASLFTAGGLLVSRLGEVTSGHGQLIAGLIPLLVLVWLALHAQLPLEAVPFGLEVATLAACPGLLFILGQGSVSPINLPAVVLGTLALLTVLGLAIVLSRRDDVL